MKVLSEILYKCRIIQVIGSTHIAVSSVASDSRKVQRMSCFVAVKGVTVDGHQFIDQVIEAGAVAIVCETLPEKLAENTTYVKVQDSAEALGYLISNFLDNPSSKLKLVGVTGTNGKTTVATLMYKLFSKLGYTCGLLSTVQNKIGDITIQSTHTTPDAIAINELLKSMIDAGCEYCFMEVSSHAAHQKRIAGLEFKGAIFTNITHDHLDYHGTFEHYIAAKKMFFDGLSSSAFALTNKDDRNGQVMLQNTLASCHTYSLLSDSEFKCKILENSFNGLHLQLDGQDVWTLMLGAFNSYNLTAVYGASVLLGQNKAEVLTALSTLTPPQGRFQYYRFNKKIIGIIDYAHTPDALINVLQTIQNIKEENQEIITVIGCGGNRDKSKRPEMGKIAAKMSHKVIFTSDNPRNESPEEIIQEMNKGVEITERKKVLNITDRREAIKTAVSLAKTGSILMIAGKGHENYQEINGVKYPFNDAEILIETFNMQNQ